jgi:hypothetical protein
VPEHVRIFSSSDRVQEGVFPRRTSAGRTAVP